METDVCLPHKAVYSKKVLKWDACGRKVFEVFPYDVMVVAETKKSYKIKLQGREMFARKGSVKFNFLTNKDYCEVKQKHIPIAGCAICCNDCALSGKDFPRAVINV